MADKEAKEEAPLQKTEIGNGRASILGSRSSGVNLKRELGLFSAVNLILGVMIGSGIFVSPSSALEHSGSVGLCLVIWTVSGIISLLGALSFAELGTVVGKSGAEYSYFQEAFGKMHQFWGPLPSFICAWIYVMILRPAEVAIIVMTFAEYAIQPFTPELDPEYKGNAIKLASLSALSYLPAIMDSMQSLTDAINSIKYVPDNKSTRIPVDITHIDNPHNFYVRPTRFSTLVPAVQQYGDKLDASELYIGATVVYKSKIKSEYVRGQIINITEECMLYDLYTPDYGFIETKMKSKRMRKPLFPNVPPLAQRCLLADCNPIGENFSKEATESMKYFLDNEPAKIIVRTNTPHYLIVEVITSDSDDLARVMAFSNNSAYFYNNPINRHYVPKSLPLEEKTFTYKPLKADDVLHARIQCGKSFKEFFVAEIENYEEYLHTRGSLTYFCKQSGKLDSKDVKEGKAVGVAHAMYNDLFERAIIKEVISPKKVVVQLIDWGKILEVNTSTLYTIKKFFEMPAVAIYCSVEDDNAWSNRDMLLPGCNLKITIKHVGDKFNTPNIVEIS